MTLLALCKLWSIVSIGSHLSPVPVPAIAAVGPLAITPISVVSAACFFVKHPGKPMTEAQWRYWDKIYKQHGLRERNR